MTARTRVCCDCGRPILEGIGWRRVSGGKRRHANCSLAEYQLDHPRLTLEQAFQEWKAIQEGARRPDPANRRQHRRLDGIPRASNVKVFAGDGSFRIDRPMSPREVAVVVERGQRRPRTWSEARSDAGGGHDRT